jgi:hypothetical protein
MGTRLMDALKHPSMAVYAGPRWRTPPIEVANSEIAVPASRGMPHGMSIKLVEMKAHCHGAELEGQDGRTDRTLGGDGMREGGRPVGA